MEGRLGFGNDGTFHIMQLTDIHYTHDDGNDRRTVELLRNLIQWEKPDLIVVTGDAVYGDRNLELLSLALLPVTESNIPWTFLFGNHDVEFHSTREELLGEVQKLPGCLAFNDDPSISGQGNHMLEVRDRAGRLSWVIAGLDSGGYNDMEQVGGYAYVDAGQIRWYQAAMRKYERETKDFSALAFMHMALPEYHELWEMEPCHGEKNEGIGCPRINSGLFTALLEEGHTRGLFVGHDHLNDFMGSLYGVVLGYGRASGYGGYGQDGYLRGARMFILEENEKKRFTTYLRLEDESVVREQPLHRPEGERDEG